MSTKEAFSKALFDLATYDTQMQVSETEDVVTLAASFCSDKRADPSELPGLKQQSTINRIINRLLDINDNNSFDYFATLSCPASWSLDEVRKASSRWLEKYNDNRKTKLEYALVIIPYEKEGYHVHMLLSGILESDLREYTLETAKTSDIRDHIENGRTVFDWTFKTRKGERNIGIWFLEKLKDKKAQEDKTHYMVQNLYIWKHILHEYEEKIKEAHTEEERESIILESAYEIPYAKNLFSASQGLCRLKVTAKRKATGNSINDLLRSMHITVEHMGPFGFRVKITDKGNIQILKDWFASNKHGKVKVLGERRTL